jgi:hypothetical protein
MRMWSARVSAILAGCLLLAAAAGAFEFKDEVGRFRAIFPAEPTLGKDEGVSDSGPHVHYSWTVEEENRTFAVIFTEYSRPIAKNYDKNVRALLNQGAKLLRQTAIDVSGVDGREIFTELPEKAVLRQRMLLVGNRLYQVIYQGPFGTESRADVEEFMRSFQLLK